MAGRRIDADGVRPERFPLANVPRVRQQLLELFAERGTVLLVSSAACGADLIALQVAEQLGIRRRIVLPFGPERFRATSVTDRPGNWGELFDRLVASAAASGDLLVLDETFKSEDESYAAATGRIVSEAAAQASKNGTPLTKLALVVWEGQPKGGEDMTAAFRDQAEAAGFQIEPVLTTAQGAKPPRLS